MRETEIDVTLVAGRRPELLRRTLESFEEKVFRNFRVASVFVNIDPFCGCSADGAACREIALGHFPDAEIIEPDAASYGRAVKALWSKIRAPLALHLEDDWLALEAIAPGRVFPVFEGRVRMLSLMSREKSWDGRAERAAHRIRIPFTPLRFRAPHFSVSPCFVERAFAGGYAERVNPDMDPEKQVLGCRNLKLLRYGFRFESALLVSSRKDSPDMILDIGREWLRERGIEKVVKDGRSLWVEK